MDPAEWSLHHRFFRLEEKHEFTKSPVSAPRQSGNSLEFNDTNATDNPSAKSQEVDCHNFFGASLDPDSAPVMTLHRRTSSDQSVESLLIMGTEDVGIDMCRDLAYSEANSALSGYCSFSSRSNLCASAS